MGEGNEDVGVLGLSADEATRRIALRLLDEANDGVKRLREGADDEALHDFRVAIRRLRSIGKAHAKHLGNTLTRKRLKTLARIQRSTGAARDAEVQRTWVEGWRDQLTPEEVPGIDKFVEKLHTKGASPTGALRRYEKLERKLRRDLRTITRDIFESPRAYAPVLAGLARSHAAQLAAELESIRNERGDAQMRAIHDARIAGKRLRYLVEPVRKQSEQARSLVKLCKHLQDLLGDTHDMHVLIENTCNQLAVAGPWERVGLAALVRIASQHAGELEKRVAADYDAGRLDFPSAVESFAREIEDDSLEIERKYLLRALPEAVRAHEPSELAQGYLPGAGIRERLRRIRKGDQTRYVRTLKAGRGLTRIEVEEEASAELFHQMWGLTEGARVHKRRYAVPDGDLVWEIDEFLDRELVLAEVELPSEDYEFEIPEWLKPHIERDVTDEGEYVNQNLAR